MDKYPQFIQELWTMPLDQLGRYMLAFMGVMMFWSIAAGLFGKKK